VKFKPLVTVEREPEARREKIIGIQEFIVIVFADRPDAREVYRGIVWICTCRGPQGQTA
jgi:hypothetical protein